MATPEPDLSNVRVLIPRTRRAIDGPTASGSAAVSATLDDDEIKTLVADAIADVILYTGGLFGHELVVAGRDDAYGAPNEWRTDPPMSMPEETVIVAQAALNHFFHVLREQKVQETIRNEGQEWSYQLSANALSEWIKHLRQMRDDALAAISAQHPTQVYFDHVRMTDAAVAHALAPYAPDIL